MSFRSSCARVALEPPSGARPAGAAAWRDSGADRETGCAADPWAKPHSETPRSASSFRNVRKTKQARRTVALPALMVEDLRRLKDEHTAMRRQLGATYGLFGSPAAPRSAHEGPAQSARALFPFDVAVSWRPVSGHSGVGEDELLSERIPVLGGIFPRCLVIWKEFFSAKEEVRQKIRILAH
jgi:hypothetical protein